MRTTRYLILQKRDTDFLVLKDHNKRYKEGLTSKGSKTSKGVYVLD